MSVTRKVTIEEAQEIAKSGIDASIIWRPEHDLPEEQQYAMVTEPS